MSAVSVSPDIEELLLGSDWLIRNQCHWNFAAGTIKMGDLELIPIRNLLLTLAAGWWSQRDVLFHLDTRPT